MRFLFQPNTRIKLRLGNFESDFFRARRTIIEGGKDVDSEAVIIDDRAKFVFYDLAERTVLDGNPRWEIVNDLGFVYSIEWADQYLGNLVQCRARLDPKAERVAVPNIGQTFGVTNRIAILPDNNYGWLTGI